MRDQTPPRILTLILLASCAVVSLNIFLPSLSAMADTFGVAENIMSWAVSGYLLVVAAMQVIIGPLSDRFGRRPIILGSFAIFIFASLICAFSTTVAVFFAGRFLQSFVTAGMVLSQAVIRDTSASREETAEGIATLTMVMAIVPMLGPLIGGALSEFLGWKSNFFLLAAYGALGLLVAYFNLRETNTNPSATLGRQLKSYPVLFSQLKFWGYCLTIAFSAGVFYVYLVGLAIVGKQHLGYSEILIGALLAVLPVGYICGNFLTRQLSKRLGSDILFVAGRPLAVWAILASLVLFWSPLTAPGFIFLPLFFVGVANGITLPTGNAGAISLNPAFIGTAAGTVGALSHLFGSLFSGLVGYWAPSSSDASVLFFAMLIVASIGMLTSLLIFIPNQSKASSS